MTPLSVAIIGLGPVGKLCARFALKRPDLALVAAADMDPALAGKDLGEVLDTPGPLNVTVRPTLEEALSGPEKGVVMLCTGSYLVKTAPQILACLESGWRVVSTCEQLAYPFHSAPEESARIDETAKAKGLAVLGTGVNPGFTMDALPAFLSAVTSRVDSVLVERFQDASLRRLPFQQKIGAGLSLTEFEDQVASGVIRHVGFRESTEFLAATLGITLDRIEERVRPVMATQTVTSPFMSVSPGRVCGLDQICQGFAGDQARITLHLEAYFGHPDPKDRVLIAGDPCIDSVVRGGVAGDPATCAITVNAVRRVWQAPAGLRTMLDVGLVSGRSY